MKKSILIFCLLLAYSCSLYAGGKPDTGRYLIEDSVLIKTGQGHTLSAVVVRRKDLQGPQPTALLFYIYSNTAASIHEAQLAADRGYVGMVADVRGKRLSPEQVEPYENEQEDVYEVIDWISKQPWSNGKVGMYGGSYSGFAQWAGVKHRVHPALKTIVPYVANIPGQGLPMENNVFINPNYEWAFYISNNKYTDDQANNDHQRWRKMERNWYASGAPYRKIDSIDGQPNRLLQKWLKHPAYDAYWQSMVPYKNDFAHIHIPILVFDGYYNDGQASSLHYLREHQKYDPQVEDYLIIGPYDHFGAQQGGEAFLRGYRVDRGALIDTREITFQWLDHILKGGPMPAMLKNRINYQEMGASQWRHAPSIEKMHNTTLRLYLTNVASGKFRLMESKKPVKSGYCEQEIDFKDRQSRNDYSFPDPIIQQDPNLADGIAYISEPLKEVVSVNGKFTGQLRALINKKDMDYSLSFFEVMPDGRYFQFSYYLGRASYAADPSRRQLLTPGQISRIPFNNTKITSKQLSVGSSLLVIVNINKNPFAQVNYGSGKEVSEESISDAGEPLRVKWYNDSYVDIPVWKAPYTFPIPAGWTLERTPFPPAYSPNVHYTGFEEIHFPPGWGDRKSAEYWTVSYLFRLNGKQLINAAVLQDFLKVYYEGLIADNVPRRHIPKEKLVAVSAGLKKIKPDKGDVETYAGVISSFDYLVQEPIKLNCRVHLKPGGGLFTPLLIEVSPQPVEHPIWGKMNITAQQFECGSGKAE